MFKTGVLPCIFACVITLSCICFALSGVARGQVLLKPSGQDAAPLRGKSLTAEVEISGQFATTRTEMTFQNETTERIEADFIYKVPPHATVTYFAYWYGREKVVARVVEKKRAANIYRYITSRMRDPALIELIGKDTFRARIFPIMPNADLRIEMRMVQILPSHKDGASYVFPLQPAKSGTETLEKLDIRVHVQPDATITGVANNFKLPVAKDKDGYRITLSELNYRPKNDLQVTMNRPRKALQSSSYSAASGGADGFFAIVLTADRSLRRPTVTVRGIRTYDVTPATLPAVKANETVTVFGRYKGSGGAVITLNGWSPAGRWSGTTNVVFDKRHEDNNLASKLWAARYIERLGDSAKNRDRIIAMSTRYSLPSKFTSWLAIPEEERVRYREEKLRADLDSVGYELQLLNKRGLSRSRRARQLNAQFDSICRQLGTDPKEERAALRSNWDANRREVIARDLVRNIADGRGSSRQTRRLRREFEQLSRQLGDSPRDALNYRLRNTMPDIAREIIDRTYGVTPDKARARMLRRRLDRLARASQSSSKRFLDNAKSQWTWDQMHYLAQELAKERFRLHPDNKRIVMLRRQLNKITPITRTENLKSAITQAEGSVAGRKATVIARRWLSEKYREQPDTKRLAALEVEIKPYLKVTGSTLEQTVDGTKYEWARDEMNRLLPELVSELSKDKLDEKRVRQLATQHKKVFDETFKWEGQNVSTEVQDRVRSLTDLQSELSEADAAKESQKLQQLQKRRAQLLEELANQEMAFSYGSGGAGDPLISVQAPADAEQVIALLPGGEVKRLVFDAQTRQWECRFDIPTYTPDGDFSITVIIVLRDGTRRMHTLIFHVDNTAPTGTGQAQTVAGTDGGTANQLRLEVDAGEHTARVMAMLPWGEKTQLKPSTVKPQSFFALVPLPESHQNKPVVVTFVLTDKAHNRTTVTVDTSK